MSIFKNQFFLVIISLLTFFYCTKEQNNSRVIYKSHLYRKSIEIVDSFKIPDECEYLLGVSNNYLFFKYIGDYSYALYDLIKGKIYPFGSISDTSEYMQEDEFYGQFTIIDNNAHVWLLNVNNKDLYRIKYNFSNQTTSIDSSVSLLNLYDNYVDQVFVWNNNVIGTILSRDNTFFNLDNKNNIKLSFPYDDAVISNSSSNIPDNSLASYGILSENKLLIAYRLQPRYDLINLNNNQKGIFYLGHKEFHNIELNDVGIPSKKSIVYFGVPVISDFDILLPLYESNIAEAGSSGFKSIIRLNMEGEPYTIYNCAIKLKQLFTYNNNSLLVSIKDNEEYIYKIFLE